MALLAWLLFVILVVAALAAVCCCGCVVTLQISYASKMKRGFWSQPRPGALREATGAELAYCSRASLPQVQGASKVIFIATFSSRSGPGKLTARASAAVAAAVERHPALRNVLIRSDETHGYVRPVPLVRAIEVAQAAISVAEASDVREASVAHATLDANTAFQVDDDGVQRVMALHIVAAPHRDDAARPVALLLTLHHAACDGTSGLHLLGDLMRHMNATVAPPVERCDALPAPLPDRVLAQHWPFSPRPWLQGLYTLHSELNMSRYTSLFSPHVLLPRAVAKQPESPAWRALSVPIVHTLTPAQTRALREACRRRGVTVNAALHAALVMAAQPRCVDDGAPILIRTSIDLRRRLANEVSPNDLFFAAGNAAIQHPRVALDGADLAGTFWRIAEHDFASLKAWMASMLPSSLGWVLIQDALLPLLLSRQAQLATPPPCTIVTSNCGDVSRAFVGADVDEVLFFSSINAWRVLEVTAATVGDTCTLVFTCPVVLLGDAVRRKPAGVVSLEVSEGDVLTKQYTDANELYPLAAPYLPLIDDTVRILRRMAE